MMTYKLSSTKGSRTDLEPAAPICGCGAWTGEPCRATEATVLVEWMPEHLRASHEAAGNSGDYPHNGARRVWCYRTCARAIVRAEPEWASIVREREAVRS